MANDNSIKHHLQRQTTDFPIYNWSQNHIIEYSYIESQSCQLSKSTSTSQFTRYISKGEKQHPTIAICCQWCSLSLSASIILFATNLDYKPRATKPKNVNRNNFVNKKSTLINNQPNPSNMVMITMTTWDEILTIALS